MDPINNNPGKVEASIFLTMKAGLLHSWRSDLMQIQTHPSFSAFYHYLQASKDRIKNNQEKVET